MNANLKHFLFGLFGVIVLAIASDSVGIYGRIYSVVRENNPPRLKVYGTFVQASNNGHYGRPQHGFMYFSVAKGKEEETRAEWNDLEKQASAPGCTGFTFRTKVENVVVPGYVVYPEDAENAKTEIYRSGSSVSKHGAAGYPCNLLTEKDNGDSEEGKKDVKSSSQTH